MQKTGICEITGKEYPMEDLVRLDSIRPQILDLIKKKYPDWQSAGGFISVEILNVFRDEYVRQLLVEEDGELSKLDMEVMESIKNKELISTRPGSEQGEKITLGQHIADRVALFGGSWRFIIIFAAILFSWIVINSYLLMKKPFDPYPFILLNLILSCLAAIQAPVIMMSQNRQEAKDRARAENDYLVNLKAEIEIRQLHEKIDHILINQSKRLFEIQEIQIDLMEQVFRNNHKDQSDKGENM
jgi:uncharacterized membrane protein